jgi:hypothetical protein
MWQSWDAPSRFLASGVLTACVLLGWHFVARIIQ